MKKEKHFLYDMTSGEVMYELGEITPIEAEKYEDGSLRAITEHQVLVEESIVQIQNDVRDGDLTVIEGLLQTLSLETLKNFLPEKLG